MKYCWSDSGRIRIDAQKAGERLDEIRRANDGQITAELVVRDAQAKDSPLHDHFTWDKSRAALEWHLYEARYLIRYLRVVIDDSAEPRRFYVHVDAPEGKGYISVAEMLSRPEMRAQVIEDAQKGILAWRERYRELTELAAIFKPIDKMKVSREAATKRKEILKLSPSVQHRIAP